eukprot:1699712-Amphidinium_carterae.1
MWCTLHPILTVLHWSLRALANGRWPEKDHNDNSLEGFHASVAGRPLPLIGCLLQLRSDWAEFSVHMGFSQWNSTR